MHMYVISFPTLALKIPKLHSIYKCIFNLNQVFNRFSFIILQKRTCYGKHGTLEIRTYSIEPIIMQRHLVINWNVSTVIKFQYAHFFLFVEKTYYLNFLSIWTGFFQFSSLKYRVWWTGLFFPVWNQLDIFSSSSWFFFQVSWLG